MVMFLFPAGAFSAENNEMLIMKRDLAQERVLRMQSELTLMKIQYQKGQEILQATIKEFQELDEKVKALEPEKK